MHHGIIASRDVAFAKIYRLEVRLPCGWLLPWCHANSMRIMKLEKMKKWKSENKNIAACPKIHWILMDHSLDLDGSWLRWRRAFGVFSLRVRGRVRLKRRGLQDSKTLAIQNTKKGNVMFQRSLGLWGRIGWNFNSFVLMFCMHIFLYFASSFLEPLFLAGKVGF